MYCSHACLCVYVCVSVCPGTHAHTIARTRMQLGEWLVYPLVVHYWADLQSVHRLRWYGNITRTRNVSEYIIVLALCLVRGVHDCYYHYIPCQKTMTYHMKNTMVFWDWG